ncbi:MAG TPA: hypothetical protein VG605_05915 [Puia sp.]|nr:hypothetical protein [Puia sp.]
MKPSINKLIQQGNQRGSAQPLKRHNGWAKYLIAVLLLIAVVANGLTGYELFRSSEYDLSHLLIIASYACIVGTIYLLTVYRRKRIG